MIVHLITTITVTKMTVEVWFIVAVYLFSNALTGITFYLMGASDD